MNRYFQMPWDAGLGPQANQQVKIVHFEGDMMAGQIRIDVGVVDAQGQVISSTLKSFLMSASNSQAFFDQLSSGMYQFLQSQSAFSGATVSAAPQPAP